MNLEFKGIEGLQDDIQKVIDSCPEETEKELKKLGNKVKNYAIEDTPKKTENLQKGYKVSNVTYSMAGNSYVTVKNDSPHFHLIEKGHNIKNDKNGQILGYVPGKHMMENAITRLDEEFEAEMKRWTKKMLKRLG